MTKQNDKITYVAQAYTNAETVGNVDGTTVFVPQMIVGETATVKINYVKGNVAYGEVDTLLALSDKRCTPPCKYFGRCGGCTLMHMQYSEQLIFKQNKVANNLTKILAGQSVVTQFDVLPTVASDRVLGYRNKLSLPVRGKTGNVQIGMYRKGSHDVVDMDNCLLGGDWSRTLVALFRNYLNSQKIAPYNEKTFSGSVRHLVARYVDGQLLVTVVSNGKWTHDLQPLKQALQQNFEKFGLFVNINTHKNNVILGETTIHICGIPYICGKHLGVGFRLLPDSFFQVNDGVKDKIYRKVQQLLDLSQTQVLVDCFSGIGILTNVLANKRYKTYAVEINPSAVADAQEICQLNGTPNVTNVCGDVAVELPKIAAENRGKIMSLVVDPPRKGLGADVCQTILKADFDNVVYVSCDSATLARDLSFLCQKYDVTYVQPFDMFPNTAEVETVVHLVKRCKVADEGTLQKAKVTE